MNVNREQTLFIVTLAFVGLFVYLRNSDAYVSPAKPSEKRFEVPETPFAPEIEFPAPGDPRYELEGRDIFQKPRDWNPLPPLALEPPPLPAIGAVGLLPSPAVEAEHFRIFRRPPLLELSVATAAEGETGAAAAGRDPRFAGIDFGEGTTADEAPAEVSEASLEKSYDWLKRKNRPRIWGYVLNADKFTLLDDPTLTIQFKVVDVKRGKDSGTAPFQRGDLDGGGAFGVGFGFADTVRTRVVLLRRQVGANVGNVRSQLDAARTCLTWTAEDLTAALEGAEGFLRTALAFNPKEAAAWLLLGRVKDLAWDTEGELKVYDEARAQGVDNARLAARVGRIQRRLGLIELAEATLRGAVRADPNDHVAWVELGRLLLLDRRGDEAVTAFENAYKVAGLSAEERLRLRVDLVTALIRTNRILDADKEIDRALKMGIEDADAEVLKGVLLMMRGEIDPAIGEFRTALEVNPRHRSAVYNLGVAHVLGADDQGDIEQARARFAEAADLDPLTSFDSAVAVGALEEIVGNIEQAAFWFDEALLFDPGNPFGLYRAGRVARLAGDLERAELLLRESLERDGRIVDVLNELGYTAVLADEPSRAEQYLRESIRREPGNPDAHILLGVALVRLNLINAARDAFAAGLGDPEAPHPAALCGIAWCEYREGNVDQSLQRFADARAASAGKTDSFYLYADSNQAAIDDHRNKEQWVDRFDRKQIKNNWVVKEPYGPQVRLTSGGLLEISGMQRPTDPDQRTELSRAIHGATMVLLEARLTATPQSEGIVGIRFAYEKAGREGATSVDGALQVARFPDGSVRIHAQNKENDVVLDWVEAVGLNLPVGEEFQLGIELMDGEKGLFRVLVDDRVAGPEEIEVRGLKKLRKECVGGLFAQAGARQNVGFQCSLVRVVRYSQD